MAFAHNMHCDSVEKWHMNIFRSNASIFLLTLETIDISCLASYFKCLLKEKSLLWQKIRPFQFVNAILFVLTFGMTK